MPRPSTYISRYKAPISGHEALFASPHRFGFNGQEKVDEISGLGNHYTAEFWECDNRLGRRWNIDPVVKPHLSSYQVFANSPIWRIDPNGANDDEYDKDGNKISDLGGDKVNFYHQANGDTKVEDQTTCATTTITGGEALIRGYTQRTPSTSWSTITNEFLTGTGPTNSMFADFSGTSTSGPFRTLHDPFSSYTGPAREDMLSSTLSKNVIKMDYGNANPLVANDMWEQMWGRSNVSWYKLGDKTLFFMNDSKSATSLFLRATGNWERSSGSILGNTRQTYIWIENNSDIKSKVNIMTQYFHQLYEKLLQESQRSLPGKI